MKETFACQSLGQQSISLLYQWNYGFSAMSHPQTGMKCSVTLIKLMLRTFKFSWDLHCKTIVWTGGLSLQIFLSLCLLCLPLNLLNTCFCHLSPLAGAIMRSVLPCCVITEQTSAHWRAITGLKKNPPFLICLNGPFKCSHLLCNNVLVFLSEAKKNRQSAVALWETAKQLLQLYVEFL